MNNPKGLALPKPKIASSNTFKSLRKNKVPAML
jgi:hypothetical protein